MKIPEFNQLAIQQRETNKEHTMSVSGAQRRT